MAFVGTIYGCQFWVAHEDGSSGDNAMTVLGPTCDSSDGEDIKMSVMWTKSDGNTLDQTRWQFWGPHAMAVRGTT
jgi:hypothetical protein